MYEKTRILLDFEIVNLPADRPLTPEAATRLSDLWDRMYAKEKTRRGGPAPRLSVAELQIPPEALLERCTENGQGDSDTLEIMIDLLQSRGHVQVVSNPRVEVMNGKRAEVKIVREERHIVKPARHSALGEETRRAVFKTVECGTVLNVTPHANDEDRVVLEFAVEITDLIPSDGANELPLLSTYSINSTAILDNNKTLVLRLAPKTEAPAQDDDILYLLVRPHIVPVESAAAPRTVTATFLGTDLRRALEEVSAKAGANLMYDADLSGSVCAKLQDVPLEKALETVLAASPYIARPMPDGYAIITREKPPTQLLGEKKNTVEVEARLLLVDEAFMEALRSGLPIEGVTVPEDVNALHEIGAGLVEGQTPLLEQAQVSLLLKAIRRDTNSKTLAAPRVTMLDGESATVSLSQQLDYVSGYREPSDTSQEPIPQHASTTVGVRFDVTPHLIENRNHIRLPFETEISALLDMQKAMYKGKYEYDVPSFETITMHTEIVVPDGETALVYGGEVRSLGLTPPGKEQPARPLLILIKATKTQVDEDESEMPFIPTDPAHLPGGMGGFAPGQPLPSPVQK